MNHIEHLYYLLKQLVRLNIADAQSPSTSLNTWAVLASYIEASDEQLTKTLDDIDKPYFFSHDWCDKGYPAGQITHDYPGLYAMPSNSQYNNLLSGDCKTTVDLELIVLDQYTDRNGQRCYEYRNRFELWRDTETLLIVVFKLLGQIAVYRNPLNSHRVYLPKNLYPFTAGLDIDQPNTLLLQNRFKTMAQTLRVVKWRGGVNDLYGALVNIQVEVDCCQKQIEYDLDDWQFEDVKGWTIENDRPVWYDKSGARI